MCIYLFMQYIYIYRYIDIDKHQEMQFNGTIHSNQTESMIMCSSYPFSD